MCKTNIHIVSYHVNYTCARKRLILVYFCCFEYKQFHFNNRRTTCIYLCAATLCSYLCASTFVHLHLCSYLCASTFMRLHLCIYICAATFVQLPLCSYLCASTFVQLPLCIYICAATFVHLHFQQPLLQTCRLKVKWNQYSKWSISNLHGHMWK